MPCNILHGDVQPKSKIIANRSPRGIEYQKRIIATPALSAVTVLR